MQANTIRLAQQFLVVFRRAGLEIRIGQHIDEGQQELVLVADALHLVIHVEHFALVQPPDFPRYTGKRGCEIASSNAWRSKYWPALRIGDVAVSTQRDIVCGQTVGSAEETQVAPSPSGAHHRSGHWGSSIAQCRRTC